MKQQGITQSVLAEKLGIKQSSVSEWFKKGTTPKTERLAQIAAVFGVTVNQLMYSEEDIKRENEKDARIRELEQQLLKTTQELLEYKTRENERLKNNPTVSTGQ